MKTTLSIGLAFFAAAMAPALAASSFQNSCSNIAFAYVNNQAGLQAVCLRADGTANPSTLILQGTSNQNGKLTQGSGASTFQQSCGNIHITIDGANVTLAAYCRTSGGSSSATSIPLNNISNNNGTLAQ
jgi:hypothetical protein